MSAEIIFGSYHWFQGIGPGILDPVVESFDDNDHDADFRYIHHHNLNKTEMNRIHMLDLKVEIEVAFDLVIHQMGLSLYHWSLEVGEQLVGDEIFEEMYPQTG